MNNERGQSPNEVIIWGYKYTCNMCETYVDDDETAEAAEERRAEHRERAHSGMKPKAGDLIEKFERRREPAPEESSSGGGWIILVILVVGFLAAKR
ncbi:hypothetical protein OG909_21330 [Streptomyces sp. NBC_01754]|uniref:hypothetical protein n=1 Tax=Streptomyces sp. NBC_01754 TaxID=2975930 RepID=UPI002DDA7000|nr:hypothetical protein [Streptomyces sp. NBC_01754]WSC94610.1 hypothetical protein OG909_21330 [Streptomyces sp. NBC_01754]